MLVKGAKGVEQTGMRSETPWRSCDDPVMSCNVEWKVTCTTFWGYYLSGRTDKLTCWRALIVIGLIRSGFPVILFFFFFFSIQMLLGMATELQPILRPIWETTARLTLYSVVKPSAEVITWARRHEGIKRLPLAHDGHHGTSPFLWLSCTFLWIFLKDVFMHVVRYSDSEYLNNWYNVPSRIRPFSREMDQLNFTTLVKENVLENIASKWRSFCIVTN